MSIIYPAGHVNTSNTVHLHLWTDIEEAKLDIIKEITSIETIDDIEKREYYAAGKDADMMSIRHVPNYLIDELTAILHIDENRDYPFNKGFLAACLNGCNHYCESVYWQSIAKQYDRFLKAGVEGRLSLDDKQDITEILRSRIKLSDNDLNSGYRFRFNFRCPEYIKSKIVRPCKVIQSISVSTFVQRFVMFTLKDQIGIQQEYKEVMESSVLDLYTQTYKLYNKLRKSLNGALGEVEDEERELVKLVKGKMV